MEQARRQTGDTRGVATAAAAAWKAADATFARYEAAEAGWDQARRPWRVPARRPAQRSGLGAGTDRGGLAPRCRDGPGPRCVGFLQAAETLTFLDRLHRQLEEAEPDAELREAVVRLWWLRRQRPRGAHGGAIAGAGHVAHLVQQVVCQRWTRSWAEWYRRVSGVLRQTVRASSAVECMNSVLRMHQSRHRTVTQGLLDLKRLYWNSRAFREGKRRGRCPYEHLGLRLPSYDFWALLRMPVPERDDLTPTSVKFQTYALGRSPYGSFAHGRILTIVLMIWCPVSLRPPLPAAFPSPFGCRSLGHEAFTPLQVLFSRLTTRPASLPTSP